jgi:hypothetical protein
MGVSGQVSPTGFHGEGHMDSRLIYMEYCSVPGVHRQNGRVCPGVHNRLPWGRTHGHPAHLHGILFCNWGPRVEWTCLARCPPQASTGRDTWAPGSSTGNTSCTWGPRVDYACLPKCPPQASTGRDTLAPGSPTWNTVLYLGSTGRIGVSAQVSTTGFHGEGHMGAWLIHIEYCSVPGVRG